MTVLDNIMVGRHIHMKMQPRLLGAQLYWGAAERRRSRNRELRRGNHRLPRDPAASASVPVGTLPYGLQKRVELGRALARRARLLLLDEPMAGMNVEEKEVMARFILDAARSDGDTIVLIEHDMGVVDATCPTAWMVLNHGSKIADGSPNEVQSNQAVIDVHAAFSMPAGTGTVATSQILTRADSTPLRPSSNVTSVEMSASRAPL